MGWGRLGAGELRRRGDLRGAAEEPSCRGAREHDRGAGETTGSCGFVGNSLGVFSEKDHEDNFSRTEGVVLTHKRK